MWLNGSSLSLVVYDVFFMILIILLQKDNVRISIDSTHLKSVELDQKLTLKQLHNMHGHHIFLSVEKVTLTGDSSIFDVVLMNEVSYQEYKRGRENILFHYSNSCCVTFVYNICNTKCALVIHSVRAGALCSGYMFLLPCHQSNSTHN